MNQFLQNVIFFYILKHPELVVKCQGEYFDSTYLKVLFDILKPFVIQYKQCPSLQQAIDIVKVEGKEQQVPIDVVTMVYQHENKLDQYEDEWLDGNVKAWLTWNTTTSGLRKTISYVKTISQDVNFENYQEINEKIKCLFNNETQISFDDDEGVDFFDPEQHKTKKLTKTSTGYQFLDTCSKGGYWGGSLWCFVGAPKSGKSLWLQNLCAKSVSAGNDCAYISLELQTEIINQRIGSNLFNISSYDYEKVVNDQEVFSEKIKAYRNSLLNAAGYLWVKEFATSTASVFDLENALLKKEEQLSISLGKKFKFKNVYVDYINILKNYRNPNSENTYMKIKQIAEDLRALGQRNNWCIITATQTNRSAAGSTDVGYSSISESYGLIATVDMLFGIIVDVAMKAQGIYYLKVVANRVTPLENVRKRFWFDKSYLRIDEDKESPIIDDNEILDQLANGSWTDPSIKKSSIISSGTSSNSQIIQPKPVIGQAIGSELPTTADLAATETSMKSLFNL
jgi:hypothetical protein